MWRGAETSMDIEMFPRPLALGLSPSFPPRSHPRAKFEAASIPADLCYAASVGEFYWVSAGARSRPTICRRLQSDGQLILSEKTDRSPVPLPE